VAAQGLVWELPGPEGSPLRVTAAQLQHRVPCWGYVLQVRKVTLGYHAQAHLHFFTGVPFHQLHQLGQEFNAFFTY
jgi:hypothetical protein